jgi:hypothetical protein
MLPFSVMGIVFAAVGLAWTTARLRIRWKRYWWDDLSAGLASLFQIMLVTLLVVSNHRDPLGKSTPAVIDLDAESVK